VDVSPLKTNEAHQGAAGRKTGVLLINLGSPEKPTTGAVRRYLREFLGDPRVLQMPAAARWLLLNLFILPFRPKKSAAAYADIWTDQGSPLLVYGKQLRDRLQESMGRNFQVELAMRYGYPDVTSALQRLRKADCEQITVVPLFPQYAASTYGSTLAHVYEQASEFHQVLPLKVVPPFFDHPAFIRAWKEVAEAKLAEFSPDHVVMSFHGLPESQVKKSAAPGVCRLDQSCCETVRAENRYCYRAHCHGTAKRLGDALNLPDSSWTMSFQSRLGPTPWLKPYTDGVLEDLARTGKKRIAVICPAFVSDNLETLEEIGQGERDRFLAAGGEAFLCVPSLNASQSFVTALKTLILEA
jgi:ferrochelatase